MPKRVIGLIGSIGSGKSRVAAELIRHGAVVISGDKLGHEALQDPEIKAAAINRWGADILDEKGNISRRRLGKIVFADAKQRQALEDLSFPYIGRRIGEEIARVKKNDSVPVIVLDAAVMLEAGWNKYCDRLVYVRAPRAIRLQRLAQERGLSEQEVAARESAQLPESEKEKRADVVLDNSGSPEELATKVAQLIDKLTRT